MKSIAVYPGSFDPITFGHVDIITRALKIFSELIVLVAHNPDKNYLFSVEERVEMIYEVVGKKNGQMRIDSYSGLLVEYAKKVGANVILRGLRAVSDFEYEFQMALMNRRLDKDVETVFLMTGYQWFYTSSNLIKQAACMGGDVAGLVPDLVNKKLAEKFRRGNL